jgi:hypothetical protein
MTTSTVEETQINKNWGSIGAIVPLTMRSELKERARDNQTTPSTVIRELIKLYLKGDIVI